MNLRETPIPLSDIVEIVPVYEKPFLPIQAEYLTGVKLILANRDTLVISEAEWIHPDGMSMGNVDISSETYMVDKRRISEVLFCRKGTSHISGVKICLSDGGAFILTDGIVVSVN